MSPRILPLCAALLLGGCGFHLQGRTPLPAPLALTYLQAEDQQTDFVQDLRKALLASGARLTGSPSDASGTVRIVSDQVKQTVSVGFGTQYFRASTSSSTPSASPSPQRVARSCLPEQELSLSRNYSFDERALLAKENEAALLRESLAHDLVGIVMRRLGSL